MTGAARDYFPADDLDARRAALACRYVELPGLAHHVSVELGYNLITLYLDQPGGRVLTVDADEDGDRCHVEALPAGDWLARYDLDPDFADDYRDMTDAAYSPDLAPLVVPAPAFVAEVDAVLAAAGLPVPPAAPPQDLGPAQALAEALAELVDTYPTDAPGGPLVGLTLTDPANGTARTIALQPGHAAWLARLVRAELVTSREAHAGGSGRCGHCGAPPADDDGDRAG